MILGSHSLVVLLGLRSYASARRNTGREVRWQIFPRSWHSLDSNLHPVDAGGGRLGRLDRPDGIADPHGPRRGHDLSSVERYVGTMDATGREIDDRIDGVCRCPARHGTGQPIIRPDPTLLQLARSFLRVRRNRPAMVPRMGADLLQQSV